MTDYKVFKYQYFNERGKSINKYFYIKYKTKFLWWTYWKTLKHTECGMGDCYKTRTTFKTVNKATEFIQNVLCKGNLIEKSKETEIKIVNCK